VWNKHDRVESCRKCNALKGYTWTFMNEVPTVLTHPEYGVVWDLRVDQSRAHGLQEHNCRCWLNITVDDSDVYPELDRLDSDTAKLNSDLEDCVEYVKLFLSLVRNA